MSFPSLLRRIAVLLLAAVLPAAGIGLAIGWVRGAIAAEACALILLLAASWRSEPGILRAYRVRRETPEGARRSLERVVAVAGGKAPHIFVFSDPSPQALVVRGLTGPGSILLSEGLLGVLSEEDLRFLLQASVLGLRARGMRLRSLCAWLAHLTLQLAPRAWVELLFGDLRWHEDLGALGAMRFLALYSAARFWVHLGRDVHAAAREKAAAVNAVRALSLLPSVSGEIFNPGSVILHFTDPWASRSLLPL